MVNGSPSAWSGVPRASAAAAGAKRSRPWKVGAAPAGVGQRDDLDLGVAQDRREEPVVGADEPVAVGPERERRARGADPGIHHGESAPCRRGIGARTRPSR